MRHALFSKMKEALFSVLPVAAIVLLLSFTPLITLTVREGLVFSLSALFLILGIALFNLGADLAMTPMGEHVGEGLTKSRKLPVLFSVAFAMGLFITIAEPDLSVLARQAESVFNSTLLIATVGVGVGLFLLIGVMRVVYKRDLSSLLLFFYLMLFAAAVLLIEKRGPELLPLAFDSGGVTTGPITVPFIMAMGMGIAMTLGGNHAAENSFGLIALCSIGPIVAMLLLSFGSSGALSYEIPDYSVSSHLGSRFLPTVLTTMVEVARSLFLIVLFFAVLQVTVLKLPKNKLLQILFGILYTFAGLVIFLSAVTVGFMPVGFRIGEDLAKAGAPVLTGFSFLLGLVVVLAEPAVHVLNKQVEEMTGGLVTKRAMLIALSAGVGVSLALATIRMVFGFSLLYYLIPGYLISLGLSFFVPRIYTAIAFDSGGVASGPLTSSFILPLTIGACAAMRGESQVLSFAFGVVAMVAMTPLITIQLLGFRAVTLKRVQKRRAMRRLVSADDMQIITFD